MGIVADFFDQQQKTSAYADLKALTRGVDRAVADIMNREAVGRTLSVGGVWEFFENGPGLAELTVLDLSTEMLKSYAPAAAKTVVGDLYSTELPADCFDVVVFALILHHVAEGGWGRCRQRINEALGRARRWLKPGGRLLIIEACPAPAWIPVQRFLLPATKFFLKLVKQPLVVMHERAFYEDSLRQAGFIEVSSRRVTAAGLDDWTWFPVFMAVPWLKMPLKFYPKMHILAGSKPGGGGV